MSEGIRRELIYLWYYFDIQFRQIAPYWALGMALGSGISVFAKDSIHGFLGGMRDRGLGLLGVIPASLLGIASPLCMYGTIPLAASFSRHGMREDWLASFMMSSILLNPQLILYSTALGPAALLIRLLSCFVCGVLAGVLVHIRRSNKKFFDFTGFGDPISRDVDPGLFLRFMKNLGRNVKATGCYFLAGIVLSALFQRYVPSDVVAGLFGKNKGFGVLLAAAIGVPLYVCGGGTIPLLIQWLADGMRMGSAAAFMVTGPATKITNLGALKIVLGVRHFVLYLVYVMVFSMGTGWIVNGIVMRIGQP